MQFTKIQHLHLNFNIATKFTGFGSVIKIEIENCLESPNYEKKKTNSEILTLIRVFNNSSNLKIN